MLKPTAVERLIEAARAAIGSREPGDLVAALQSLECTLKEIDADPSTRLAKHLIPPPFSTPVITPYPIDDENIDSVIKGLRVFYWRQYKQAGSGTHYFFWLIKKLGITFETIPDEMSVEEWLDKDDK